MWEKYLERLADIEHQRWAGWQKYLHSKCEETVTGDLIIPAGYVKHLERQINTPYAELTDKEKDSDRQEVHKTLASLPKELDEKKVEEELFMQTGIGRTQCRIASEILCEAYSLGKLFPDNKSERQV